MDAEGVRHQNERMDRDQQKTAETFHARMPLKYRIGFLVLGAASTISVTAGMMAGGLNGIGLILGALMALLFVATVMMQAVVRLDAGELSISVARIFRTSIPYHRIDGVQPAKATGLGSGMGLRIMPNSTTGYLVGGPAVRISTGSTSVLVSTDAPTELTEAIERRRSHQIR